MTCPYCQREIHRYQKSYEDKGIPYHEWCYQNKICRDAREALQRNEPVKMEIKTPYVPKKRINKGK